jgi:hypothetical protein
MNAFISLLESKQKSHFRVDYPYYGLFGTAEVTKMSNDEGLYECKLRNGKTVVLKKIHQKWVDTLLNDETPLSHVIGVSIDDFLKK